LESLMKPSTAELIELIKTMASDGDFDFVDVLAVVEFLLRTDWSDARDPRTNKWELPKWW